MKGFSRRKKMRRRTVLGIVIAACAAFLAAAEATPPPPIIYVDDDAAGADNGSSWRDAFTNLQTALYVGKGWNVEIHVAQGIYKPSAVEDRNAIFELPGGLPVKGGYAGFSEPDPNAIDFNHYATILSGDLAGDDVEVADPYNLLIEQPKRAENSYNIIKVYGAHDPPIILDGFTIVGALDSCISLSHSNAIITNCTFKNNTSQGNGGVLNSHNSRAIFVRCTFITNAAGSSGGVVCMDGCGTCDDSYAAFHDCRFINNWAAIAGGAVYSVSNTFTTFINCIIAGNTAGTSGGGLYDGGEWGSSLVNCTITTNKAPTGAGICTGGGRWRRTTLNNCILWSNYSDQIDGSGANITFSDIQDGWTDAGNIAADPCFVSPGYLDTNGLWIDGDYHLRSDSPCINKGDPNFVAKPSVIECPPGYYFYPLDPKYIAKSSEMDLDSKHRVAGGRVDMGAFEYQTVFYWYVDDNAPNDPGPGDPCVSDPLEDGTEDYPYDTIQEAIDTAIDGDTIIVAEGKYFENINFKGKNINLRSKNPNSQDIVAATIIDGNNLESAVTFAGTEDETCILSGFTIRNGFDCNYVSRKGGGISGGSRWNHTRATIRNNTITRNHSEGGGGGISYCDGLIEKNTITGNTSHYWQGGGGLYFCNGLIRNNLITGNKGFGCEGVAGLKACCGIVQNCTISGNADGIWGGVDYCPTISNCIIWGNSPPQMSDLAAPSYSCIQDWNGTGAGNTSDDPCFVSPGYWDSNGVWIDGDYHLKSQAGRWHVSEGRWTIDDVTSPCIDAGDPLGPIGLEPFPNGGIVNMGAYGGTAEASKSYFGKPPCETIVAGDINGDCEIDFRDFFFVALHWLENYNQ
jgi:hypothetical protein